MAARGGTNRALRAATLGWMDNWVDPLLFFLAATSIPMLISAALELRFEVAKATVVTLGIPDQLIVVAERDGRGQDGSPTRARYSP